MIIIPYTVLNKDDDDDELHMTKYRSVGNSVATVLHHVSGHQILWEMGDIKWRDK